jgi:hypothetical protein
MMTALSSRLTNPEALALRGFCALAAGVVAAQLAGCELAREVDVSNEPAAAVSTLVLQPDGSASKDTIVFSYNWHHLTPAQFAANPQLTVTDWTFGGAEGTSRVLLQFDLSAIPPGATVVSAALSLYSWADASGSGPHSSLSGSDAAWIERVVEPWTLDSVTWDNQPASSEEARVALPESTAADEDYLDVDVGQQVQAMVDDPAHAFGFLIKLQDEAYYRRLNFASSEHPNPAKHPKLSITYQTP